MHVERLTKLAELMDRVEAEKKPFDIRVWYFPKRSVECGYVACAIGHATVDPWFNSQGLQKMEVSPTYGGFTGFTAVEKFFDIPYETAAILFQCEGYAVSYPSAADVAAKIRRYIADNQQQQPE